jgi:citrate synthase
MFDDLKQNVRNLESDGEVSDYLIKLLNREAFDRAGLIYGIGHAVYSLSDPRAVIIRDHVRQLAAEKQMDEEFELYARVERLAPQIVADRRKMYKGISANVDFYSGLLYRLLNIPSELFTPLFAMSRIAGWSAHRIEEIANAGKIIRPAYQSVVDDVPYQSLEER